MTEIAKAYVQIVPTTEGIKSNLSGVMDGEAEKSGKSAGSKWASGLGAAAKGAVGTVTAVTAATAAMGTAAVKAAGETAAYGDNIDKMSQKMGMSAEAYQEWDAIMQHSGTSIESMQAGMKTLATAAETGNAAFEKLGISQAEIANMDQEQLFAATITALQNVSSETERTYLAGQLLGRGATELGPLLNTSAEDTEKMRQRVHELGGVMSNEAVKAAAAYQDSLQDMQTAIQGLTRSFTAELLPGITQVMDGIAEVFTGNGETGLGMISQGIDSLITSLTEQLPRFIEIGMGILDTLITAIIENLPKLAESAIQIIQSLAMTLIQNLPKLIEAGGEILLAIADGLVEALPELIPAVVEVVLTIVEKLTEPDTLMKLIEAAFKIIGALAEGLLKAVPKLIEKVPQIIGNLIQAILEFLPQMLESGAQLIVEMAKGIVGAVPEIIKAVIELLANLKEAFFEKIEEAKEWGRDLIGNFASGIKNAAGGLWNTVKSIAGGIKSFLGFSEPEDGPLSNFHTYAPDMMRLFAQGIRENEYLVTDQIEKSFDFGRRLAPAMAGSGSSAPVGGDTFYITIDAASVREFNDIVEMAQSARVQRRMR